MIRMEDAGAIKRAMFNRFMDVARRVGPALRDRQPVARLTGCCTRSGDVLVYGPLAQQPRPVARARGLHRGRGDRAPDLFAFYRAIGVNLKQLYGSTETAVFVCMQPDDQVRADTVGIPCRDVEIQVTAQRRDPGALARPAQGLLQEPAATGRGAHRPTAGTTPATPASSMRRAT
jgi:long-chain acyl-CoA synthetase